MAEERGRCVRVEKRNYSRNPWRLIDGRTGLELAAPRRLELESGPVVIPDYPLCYPTKAAAIEALGEYAADVMLLHEPHGTDLRERRDLAEHLHRRANDLLRAFQRIVDSREEATDDECLIRDRFAAARPRVQPSPGGPNDGE